ncbi:MAG: acyltransferase [Bacteroidales bacterium]|jgi:phenylacetate-coenzyme A ligase PaaK-like adenylate-forming protein|nr:acyltransferase [Bacteroidales bacterium]
MIQNSIFDIQTESDFEQKALEVFRFQYNNCDLYQLYCTQLGKNENNVQQIGDIPFLPIDFFKTHKIIAKNKKEELFFTSSGTTGKQTSTHYVADTELYKKSLLKSFELFVGKPENFAILALLPAYLEKKHSSLVYMMNCLIEKSPCKESGFYLHNTEQLLDNLQKLTQSSQPTILFGAAFGILDLIENQSIIKMPNLLIFETGGMKGKHKEINRQLLHVKITSLFGVQKVGSEYGMTELLSQAYSTGDGIFYTPPWMKIFIRNPKDPFEILPAETAPRGGINVIDLANIYSCSFIATQDLGHLYPDNGFEVLGRFDYADIRGCNMLVES